MERAACFENLCADFEARDDRYFFSYPESSLKPLNVAGAIIPVAIRKGRERKCTNSIRLSFEADSNRLFVFTVF